MSRTPVNDRNEKVKCQKHKIAACVKGRKRPAKVNAYVYVYVYVNVNVYVYVCPCAHRIRMRTRREPSVIDWFNKGERTSVLRVHCPAVVKQRTASEANVCEAVLTIRDESVVLAYDVSYVKVRSKF